MDKACAGGRHRPLLQSGALVRIGDHVGERLSCKPRAFFVEWHVPPQCAGQACEAVVAESVAPAVIEHGIAALVVFAQIVVNKHADRVSLTAKKPSASSVAWSRRRTAVADWIGRAGVAMDPLAPVPAREAA